MSTAYHLAERLPTPEAYRDICAAVGWEPVMNFDAAPASLARSLYAVIVLRDGEAVGMGRIVGDGAIYFYLQDIAVKPGHQRKGLGARILEALMAHIQRNAPDKAFVGLFASEGKATFYERYGFSTHPALTGMFTVVRSE